MQKITPHLWFDREAKEAAEFYTSVFASDEGAISKIKNTTVLHDTPSGSVDLVNMELWGQEFGMISAGPLFKFNPSVSFLVGCKTKDEVDRLWAKLSKGGMTLMELGAYPFSEWYGWIQDRFGLSWQILSSGGRAIEQRITPVLLFVGNVCGKADEAVHFYTSVFHDAKVGNVLRYGKGEAPDREATVKYAAFTLEGQGFAAMDSAHDHKFQFNEAISFIVNCQTQDEIDYYWSQLSAVPAAEQCGWLKDRYGLSWQVTPEAMGRMLADDDPEKLARLTQAFLKMKKFDIEELEKAFQGTD